MGIGLVMTVVLRFLVDWLLRMGTNRFLGYPMRSIRCMAGACAGGVQAAMSMLPGFRFLGNMLWRLVFLGLECMLAFEWNHGTLRPAAVYFLLSMALCGISQGFSHSTLGAVAAAGLLLLLYRIGFWAGRPVARHVPVRLRYGGKTTELMALWDTGNTLRDPITGEAVLVLGADAAYKLVGLSAAQLSAPVETVAEGGVRGLRLLPYRSVGQGSGMLICLRLEGVWINGKPAGTLVAFAPECLDPEGTYQALAGGML